MRWIRMVLPAAIFAGTLRLYALAGFDGQDALDRVLAGAMLSAVVLILVARLRRHSGAAWTTVGHHSLGRNIREFSLGAALWLASAAVGVGLCTALGWSSIKFATPPAQAVAALPLLALAVLLVEALPEEFAVRGWAQGLAAHHCPQWLALLLQAALFIGMAWLAGAMQSPGQWMFLPGFALILGYVRALSGSVWAGMGVHFAWMTTSQFLHAHTEVEGMAVLLFLAFALLPSATLGAVLGAMRPGFRWNARQSTQPAFT